jgi:glycosyltransferase
LAVLVSEKDAGIAAAMNKGLALAHGEAVMFLHAGDALYEPGVLAQIARAWDPGRCAWATGGTAFCADSGAVLSLRQPAPDAAEDLVRCGCRIGHPATIARRSLFDQFGNFDTTFSLAMDYELWLRWFGAGLRPQVLPFPVARFFVGGTSADTALRYAQERRARALHGRLNPPWTEGGLWAVAQAKRLWPAGRRCPRLYRLKERLRL